MKHRRLSKKVLREQLMWTHTVRCTNNRCSLRGEPYTWAGRSDAYVEYHCRKCWSIMPLEHNQVRTKDEANLILNNLHIAELCPNCERKKGHYVVLKDGAYFLECICGEELCELSDSEVRS